jgi:hypothetical protein
MDPITQMSALEVLKMSNLAMDRYYQGEQLSEQDYTILGISRSIIIQKTLDDF